jgi:hypothetical protein
MVVPRMTVDTGREGFPAKMWAGQLVSDKTLVAANTPFGRGVINIGSGEMQVPDRGDLLGNGATSDEVNKFLGILLGHINPKDACYDKVGIDLPTVETPVGRGDEDFFEPNTVQAYAEVGFIHAIAEEAVVEGDQVTLRVAGVDEPTGLVLGGFGTTAVADEALVLPGLFWGADADALGLSHIKINIK